MIICFLRVFIQDNKYDRHFNSKEIETVILMLSVHIYSLQQNHKKGEGCIQNAFISSTTSVRKCVLSGFVVFSEYYKIHFFKQSKSINHFTLLPEVFQFRRVARIFLRGGERTSDEKKSNEKL